MPLDLASKTETLLQKGGYFKSAQKFGKQIQLNFLKKAGKSRNKHKLNEKINLKYCTH